MAQKFCTYCGAQLKPNLKFCPKCGKPIRQHIVNASDLDTKQSGNESANTTLKTIFRIWDVIGSCVPLPLWLTSFFLLIGLPSESDYESIFNLVIALMAIQALAIIAYEILVIIKKSKAGRIVTSLISFGLALALLLIGFTNLDVSTGFELLGILESVIVGFFFVGFLVSIFIKSPSQKQKEEI